MSHKKFWHGWGSVGAAAVALSIVTLSAGCGDNKPAGPKTPPELNGTWSAATADGVLSLYINDGAFEMRMDGSPIGKGTCSASGNTFAMTADQIHGYMMGGLFELKWYTKDELKEAVNAMLPTPLTDAKFEEQFGDLFKPQKGTYVLNGNTMSIAWEGDTQVFTRQ